GMVRSAPERDRGPRYGHRTTALPGHGRLRPSAEDRRMGGGPAGPGAQPERSWHRSSQPGQESTWATVPRWDPVRWLVDAELGLGAGRQDEGQLTGVRPEQPGRPPRVIGPRRPGVIDLAPAGADRAAGRPRLGGGRPRTA